MRLRCADRVDLSLSAVGDAVEAHQRGIAECLRSVFLVHVRAMVKVLQMCRNKTSPNYSVELFEVS